jgi:ABC-type amino acid transport substrate-binding protein
MTKPNHKPGPYNKILATFNELEVVFAPPARVDYLFQKHQIDCIFPASTATMSQPENFLESLSVNQNRAFLFTKKRYVSIEQFAGKNIAIRRGFSIGNIRKKLTANFIELNTDEALIEFLNKNRVDGIIAYFADIKSAYIAKHQPLDFYLADSPIYEVEERFVCHKSTKTKSVLKRIDKTIAAMVQNGQFGQLLSE